MGDESVRWTVMVDKGTDIDVRTHLAQRGMKKGDLSKYIKEAVRWRLVEDAAAEARKGLEGLTDEDVETMVDDALAIARRG